MASLSEIAACLREENARLTRELSRLRSELATAHSRSEHASNNALCDAEAIAVARKALEWYAQPHIYEPEITLSTPYNDFAQDHGEAPEVLEDAGSRARAALRRLEDGSHA